MRRGHRRRSHVEFVDEGGKSTARAKNEGRPAAHKTILTMEMLELSGIDNPDILTKIGIKPKIDLPSVGENVQEHSFCALRLHSPHTRERSQIESFRFGAEMLKL